MFKGKHVGWKGTTSLIDDKVYLVQILYDHAKPDPSEAATDKLVSPYITADGNVYDLNPLRCAMYTRHCKVGRIENESGEIVDSVMGNAFMPFIYVTGEIIKKRSIFFYPNSMPGGEIEAKKRAWQYGYEGPRFEREGKVVMGNLCNAIDVGNQKTFLLARLGYDNGHRQKEEDMKRQAFTEWIKQQKGVK